MSDSENVQNFIDDRSRESFGKVVNEHLDLIRKVIYRLVLNEEDADDLAQETFISAYQKADQFKGDAKFSTWLCKIAHNHAYSHLRKKKIDATPLHEVAELATSKQTHPDAALHRNDMQQQIDNAMAELPHDLRAAIITITIDETPMDEAAFILGCNKATLYWRIHKARELLKKALGIRGEKKALGTRGE